MASGLIKLCRGRTENPLPLAERACLTGQLTKGQDVHTSVLGIIPYRWTREPRDLMDAHLEETQTAPPTAASCALPMAKENRCNLTLDGLRSQTTNDAMVPSQGLPAIHKAFFLQIGNGLLASCVLRELMLGMQALFTLVSRAALRALDRIERSRCR